MTMRTRAALATIMLALLPLAPAGADETFTFYGSGWGHGIGMSQYGAFGLAQDGWSAPEILTHYYRGTRVGSMASPVRKLRIGLLQGRHRVTLTASGGHLTLVLRGDRVGRIRSGKTKFVEASGGRYMIGRPGRTGRSRGTLGNLRVKRAPGAVATVAGWGSVGQGRLELAGASGSSMHLVAVMKPEAYLRGVAEVPSSWPRESLEAQAIAARTYAFRKVKGDPGQRRSGCACGLYGDTRDQYYAGWSKETGPSGERWVSAVAATKGLVVTYGGSLIPTYYSSSSGGFTESVQNVWVGASPAPYLKGVCDPGDWVSANGNRTWSASFSASGLTSKLRSLTGNIGTVTGFGSYDLGVSGRVRTIKVKGSSGSAVVEGWDLRGKLGLKDTRFRVGQDRNVTGKIRRAYDDLMCRPGVATAPAQEISGGKVQEFEEGRMYLNEGHASAVWLRGPVLDAYLAEGGPGSSLGLPRSLDKTSDGGWLGAFDGGTITCPPSGVCTSS